MDLNTIWGEAGYLNLLREITNQHSLQENRTGIRTKMVPGAMLKFDVERAFPAITTKKLAFDAVKGELIGFLRGYTSAAQFRELGCKIWDQNANENEAWLSNVYRKGQDDLGYIYSKLWNEMPLFGNRYSEGSDWNQIEKLLEAVKKDPTSRRLIVNAWHPEVFDRAALPPCHVMFQVLIEQSSQKMHMSMYQRSCDMFLGVPFNIASYSLLLEMIAKVTGYTPGTLTWFGADCHIYENHFGQVTEQLSREPMTPPNVYLLESDYDAKTPYERLIAFQPQSIGLINYNHHPAIKAPMAV